MQHVFHEGAASQVVKSLLAAGPPGRDGEVNTSVLAQRKQPLISDEKQVILHHAQLNKIHFQVFFRIYNGIFFFFK